MDLYGNLKIKNMSEKKFKISGSTCHNIMGIKALGEKGKSFAELWYKEQFFKRRYEFQSKYVTHGKENEFEALEMVKKYLNIDFNESDTQIFAENDFMRGTCDLLLNDLIIDVKCSWDCFTFPLLDKTYPKIDYYYQAQVYMELFNKDNYKLIYCLTDMHPSLIEKEARYFARVNNLDWETNSQKLFDKFYDKYTYTGFDLKDKIKVFDIKKDVEVINKIQERVIECRIYINELIK